MRVLYICLRLIFLVLKIDPISRANICRIIFGLGCLYRSTFYRLARRAVCANLRRVAVRDLGVEKKDILLPVLLDCTALSSVNEQVSELRQQRDVTTSRSYMSACTAIFSVDKQVNEPTRPPDFP
jgi:hypothetical protein